MSVAQAQDCPAPTAYNNSENYSVNSAYLQWGFNGPQNTSFTLEIRTTRETSWSSIAAGTSTGYSVTGLTPRTNYVWRVKADCSPFSNTATVSTDFCGAYSLQEQPTASSALLEWRSQLGTTYNLRWREQGGAWTTISSLTGTLRQSTSIPRFSLSANYSLTGLTQNTVYEWQVETLCGLGYSTLTPVTSFTATCNLPISASISSITNKQAVVSWRSPYFTSNSRFEVYYRTKEPANSQWISSPILNAGQFNNQILYFNNLSGLQAGTEYEVTVQRQCSDGSTSDFLAPLISFYTLGPPCHTSMDTIRPGLWTDPTIWSCGRVPVPSDPVYVMHDVLIPDNAIGRAQRVFYGFGGQVRLGTGARLLLGR